MTPPAQDPLKAKTRRSGCSPRPAPGTVAVLALALAGVSATLPSPGGAQQDSLPGVRLGLVYETTYFPPLAVKPFTGRFGGQAVASQVEAIVGRDLGYSDRFEMMTGLPQELGGEGVDYTLWDRLGAVWLVTGRVEGSGDGFVLVLEVHDVVYGTIKDQGRFRLPDPLDPGFRMAVHRASDAVVQWIFGEPGMASSRIAFSMTRDGGATREIYIIDSDGENLGRLTDHGDLALSPSFSPDGNRILYNAMDSATLQWRVYEQNLATGRDELVQPLREGNYYTPSYLPDGERVAFQIHTGERTGLFSYNLRQNCCLTNLTEGRSEDLSPTFSSDGEWMAFNSNRLGTAVPQVFVMPVSGGGAELISPYEYGRAGYYTAPDWAPFGDRVAFHGRVGRSGRFHILVGQRGDRSSLLQLTAEGNNEDPSWAPDGRHIVFVGERSWGYGLFVVDTATGAIRTLLRGVDVGEPDWSPTLGG
ncbi:MAG: PD40 domain-containing protein [Gemmatimonadales bacterium]|nr:MAG: PD40 domain-containing protein [Gemmatimonadales bacterium]